MRNCPFLGWVPRGRLAGAQDALVRLPGVAVGGLEVEQLWRRDPGEAVYGSLAPSMKRKSIC